MPDGRTSRFPVRRDRVTVTIAGVHLVGAFSHGVFWVLALSRLPGPAEAGLLAERMNAATTRGFGIADLLWSTPLLLIAGIGLLRGRDWGWLAAQFCHGLYAYSLTVVLVRDYYAGAPSPGTILFGPFAVFSLWAVCALWKRRGMFFGSAGEGVPG